MNHLACVYPRSSLPKFSSKRMKPTDMIWTTRLRGSPPDGAGSAAEHLRSLPLVASTSAFTDDDYDDASRLTLSERATRDIQAAARIDREKREYEAELKNEIGTEMLRRKLMENREVSAEEVEESVRMRQGSALTRFFFLWSARTRETCL